MTTKNRTLLRSADALAKSVDALAIISFLPKEHDLRLETPTVHVIDIQPDILRDGSMVALLDYCSNHIIDAIVQYRILTRENHGMVVAAFPYAILIYDLEATNTEFTAENLSHIAEPAVIHSVLSLALEIAHDGREGRSIGTAFIVGDIDELKRWSHQGVLNPYAGHPADVRDIKERGNWESVKEFSQLDGVFIIDKNGIVEAAGRYLDADSRDVNLQSGLGGRHLATAAITKVTPSVGIVVSESGGIIRIFAGGKVVAHIRTDVRIEF
ncbi:MAG: diadenylate cyclase [Methanocorpusculum sp.]|nr:diadenylate cyclase [Methanocorpusculum sp.]